MADCEPMFRSAFRAAALVCVLAAFAAKAFIPAGYMPGSTGNATFQIVICTISGPQTVSVDGAHDPLEAPAHTQADGMCDFSVNTAFDDAPRAPVFLDRMPYAAVDPAFTAIPPVVSLRFFGNASSRAPPFSSYV